MSRKVDNNKKKKNLVKKSKNNNKLIGIRECHTNFKLNKKGEIISLLDKDGRILMGR